MTYYNASADWGDVGLEVTPQWYAERAVELGVPCPEVIETRLGLVIAGQVVASTEAPA